jgi:hypothetical protein
MKLADVHTGTSLTAALVPEKDEARPELDAMLWRLAGERR